jgi:hypothetical protein
MGELNHCMAITLAILCLLIVLSTFVTVDTQIVPGQDISKYTGYPIWLPPIEGMNGSKSFPKIHHRYFFSKIHGSKLIMMTIFIIFFY